MHVSLINVKAFFYSKKKLVFHKVTNLISKCKDHSKDIKQKKKILCFSYACLREIKTLHHDNNYADIFTRLKHIHMNSSYD